MSAEETLTNAGLHFDDLNKLRILEPDTSQNTTELKEECQEFVDSKLTRLPIKQNLPKSMLVFIICC